MTPSITNNAHETICPQTGGWTVWLWEDVCLFCLKMCCYTLCLFPFLKRCIIVRDSQWRLMDAFHFVFIFKHGLITLWSFIPWTISECSVFRVPPAPQNQHHFILLLLPAPVQRRICLFFFISTYNNCCAASGVLMPALCINLWSTINHKGILRELNFRFWEAAKQHFYAFV